MYEGLVGRGSNVIVKGYLPDYIKRNLNDSLIVYTMIERNLLTPLVKYLVYSSSIVISLFDYWIT